MKANKASVIYTDLKDKINNEIFKPKEKLPSQNELCITYNVSVNTLREAIALLVSEGYLNRVNGNGTFVCDTPPSKNLIAVIMPTSDVNLNVKEENNFKDYSENENFATISSIRREALNNNIPINIYFEYQTLEENLKFYIDIINTNPTAIIAWIGWDNIKTREIFNEAAKKGIKIVFVDRRLDVPGSYFIGTDNYGASWEAIVEMKKLGAKEIVFISTPSEQKITSVRERISGARDAASDMSLKCLILETDQDIIDNLYNLFLDDNRKIGFIFVNDHVLYDALNNRNVLEKAKNKILCCFDKLYMNIPDNIDFFEIRQHFTEIGKEALKTAISQDENKARSIRFSGKIDYPYKK